MTKSDSIIYIFITNVSLIIIWNMIILMFSTRLDRSSLNPNKKMFSEKKWEKCGKFYTKILHIQKWKDSLPQHIGKNGFSKKHLVKMSQISIEYIQEFIFETCRAEWHHIMCCLYIIIAFLINPFNYAVIFSLVSLTTNMPFIFIQRYNRIRLKKLLFKRQFNKNSQISKTQS